MADIGASEPQDWVVNAAAVGRWSALRLDQFWAKRELIYFFALRDLKVRYKQAFLGVAWAGIQPLVGALTFTILFHRLGNVDVGVGESYFAFALLGFGIWTYYSTSIQAGTGSLVANADLLTKVAFPKIVAPTAALLPGFIDLSVVGDLGDGCRGRVRRELLGCVHLRRLASRARHARPRRCRPGDLPECVVGQVPRRVARSSCSRCSSSSS